MRLDHLLSKEHLAILRDRPEPVPEVHAGLVLMGGTLTSITVYRGNSVFLGGGYIGALLGPERTRECFVSDDAHQSFRRSVG